MKNGFYQNRFHRKLRLTTVLMRINQYSETSVNSVYDG